MFFLFYSQLSYAGLVFEEWGVFWVLWEGSLHRQVFAATGAIIAVSVMVVSFSLAVQRLVTLDTGTKLRDIY